MSAGAAVVVLLGNREKSAYGGNMKNKEQVKAQEHLGVEVQIMKIFYEYDKQKTGMVFLAYREFCHLSIDYSFHL